MAAKREPRGTSTGGRFAPKSHAEADIGRPLVGPADGLEVGKQYIVHYTALDDDGSELRRTAEFVYAGERGPFITSDDGSMLRKDVVTKVESNDPYEKALAAHGRASRELHDACVEKVASLVRNAQPQAASVGFTCDPDGALGELAEASYVITNRGEVIHFDDDDSKFDAQTTEAVNRYLQAVLDANEEGAGEYELELSTGTLEEGLTADCNRLAASKRAQ